MVLLSAGFAIIFIMIGARIVDLTLIQGQFTDFDQRLAEGRAGNETPDNQAATMRADITDRNGVLLATSLQTASLFADPSLVPDAAKVAQDLHRVLPALDIADTVKKLQRKGRFIWIQRNLTPDQQFAVLRLGHPGLGFRPEYRRIYPEGPLASHIVGFTSIDGHGLGGIERSFDKRLSGSTEPVKLTLDIRLQHILRREVKKAMEDFTARAGTGTILDLSNGQILAAVSLPDFDPHAPGVANDPSHFNMLTQGSYELGSTFKIFTVAGALELRHLPFAQEFDARQPLKFGRFTIHDFDAENRYLSLPEVFMYSSNIGASLMGEAIGTDSLRKFYTDLGLTKPLPLEVEEIGRPRLPNPWRDINTLTASFGHGVAVSPMQMVAAAASIVHGGILIHPTLAMDPKDQARANMRADVRVVSADTSAKMRSLMRLVVTSGTARMAEVPGYQLGGKTGTADKAVNGGYDRKKKMSSFLGFFPIDNPRYAVYILIDEPHGTKKTWGFATGGWVGAPAVARVVASMAPLLGMPPRDVPPEQDLSTPLFRYLKDAKQAEAKLASTY